MALTVTYYEPQDPSSYMIAKFGVQVPEWRMEIRNLTVIKKKDGSGWFVALPTYKNKETGEWEKVIQFDSKEVFNRFQDAVREAIRPKVNG